MPLREACEIWERGRGERGAWNESVLGLQGGTERERWPLLIRARAGFRVRVGWPCEDPGTRQLVGGVVVVVVVTA